MKLLNKKNKLPKVEPKWGDLKLRRHKFVFYYNTKFGYRRGIGFDTNSKGLRFKTKWITFQKNI